MEKIYILDTNVLIQAPYAVECVEDNEVVLPMNVLEELDNLKKEEGEKGANVRKVIRILETHRGNGNLIEGVRTEQGGILRAETKIVLLGDPNQIDRPYLDDRTNGLSYAAEHMKGSPLCWQITLLLEECERSALATEAIRCL